MMDQHKISAADIQLKLSRWKPGTFRTWINVGNPYLLPQISDAQHHVNFAKKEFETLSNNLPHIGLDLKYVNASLNKIFSSLKSAKQDLILRDRITFPYSTKAQTQVFYPTLPNDLVLEFSICEGNLIILVYGLVLVAKPQPNAIQVKFDDFSAGEVIVGNSLSYHGHVFEVLEYSEFQSAIPSIQKAIQLLTDACNECLLLTNKLTIICSE